MQTNLVPENVKMACSALLAPHGINFEQLLKQIAPAATAERFVTIAEASKRTKLSRSTLWRLISGGKIKAVKLSATSQGRVKVELASLDGYLSGCPWTGWQSREDFSNEK